jgi:DNA (cytosine-5)-methyltransferase 1
VEKGRSTVENESQEFWQDRIRGNNIAGMSTDSPNPGMDASQRMRALRQRLGMDLKETSAVTGYSLRTLYRWENGESEPRQSALRLMTELLHNTSRGRTPGSFTFIDLFAGIGGLRMAFDGIGGRCVFTSEWNKYSQQTYAANFRPDHPIAGDITRVAESEIPEHDVLLAGFPCQPFSLAGVSKKNSLGRAHGFLDETQGTLFFDVARILEYHRPKAFLLENVKNLASHDKGKTFRVITETLRGLGYHIQWRIIDAKAFVPQHRERIFIVGFREANDFDFGALRPPDMAQTPTLAAILHPEDGSESPESPYTEGPDAEVSGKYTLSDKLWAYLRAYAEKHRAKGNGFGFGLVGPENVARTLSARYHKDGSEILVKNGDANPRRLTPRECARLMGFDVPGGSEFRIPVSDTQAYRQFGNAVVVPVVSAIAKHMQPWIAASVTARVEKEAEALA